MRWVTCITTLVALLHFSLPAQAGHETSGGGNAIVCRDSSNRIVRADLLDFHVGEAVLDLEIKQSGASLSSQFDDLERLLFKLSLLQRLEPTWTRPYAQEHWSEAHGESDVNRAVLRTLRELRSWAEKGYETTPRFKLVSLPKRVEKAKDSGLPIGEEGCTEEGLAFWDDAIDRLFIKKVIFDELSDTEKLALFVHEAYYRELRLRTARSLKTSVPVQYFVAHLFSVDHSGETQLSQFWKDGRLSSKRSDPDWNETRRALIEKIGNELWKDEYHVAADRFYAANTEEHEPRIRVRCSDKHSSLSFSIREVERIAGRNYVVNFDDAYQPFSVLGSSFPHRGERISVGRWLRVPEDSVSFSRQFYHRNAVSGLSYGAELNVDGDEASVTFTADDRSTAGFRSKRIQLACWQY